MNKLLGGRYILTLATAFVFVWLSVQNWIKPSDAMQIITMVFVLYFSRNDRQPTGGKDGK